MKVFILISALLVSTCSAGLYGPVSSQYVHLDPHAHTYAYGYSDPNSKKHETRTHDGVTRGSYSYVDGHGHLQSISYTADPHHGFHAVGTNLPKGPADPHAHVHYASAHPHESYHHHYEPHAYGHHLYKRSLYAGPWGYGGHNQVALTHGGVPVDTPEVQHAKAAHFAAHAKAAHGVHGAPAVAPVHAHGLGYHVPVIHNGVPVDTPEVQHAKAAHFAALAEASSRVGHSHGHGQWDGDHSGGQWNGDHSGDYSGAYDHGYNQGSHGHSGPIHIPVIHNGVPVEPAEVQHARAAHLSALAAASHGSHSGGYHGGYSGDYHQSHYEDDGQYHAHYDHY